MCEGIMLFVGGTCFGIVLVCLIGFIMLKKAKL